MKEDHSYYRGEIERSKRRLADLEERGIEAMSRYDIEVAHGGDGQGALRLAKELVGNHIRYYGARLDELGPEVKQLDMFGLTTVEEVFNASKLEDDDLEMGLDTESEDVLDGWDDDNEELQ